MTLQLKNERASDSGVVVKLLFIEQDEECDLFLRHSALEFNAKFVASFGLDPYALLVVSRVVWRTLDANPVVDVLVGRILDFDVFYAALSQFASEDDRRGFRQLLWQRLIKLVQQHEHLFLLDTLVLVLGNQRDEVGLDQHGVEHADVRGEVASRHRVLVQSFQRLVLVVEVVIVQGVDQRETIPKVFIEVNEFAVISFAVL